MDASNTLLVSVIIPCFNQGRYVREAALSALNQTVGNLECLIVNDGSTDETEDILQSLKKEDRRRVKILYHQNRENRGLAASRNLAIEGAKGQYIGILDADDAWLPDKLESQLETFKKFQDVGLVYGQAIKIAQNDPLIPMLDCYRQSTKIIGSPDGIGISQPFPANCDLIKWNIVPCPTPLIRRSVLGSNRFAQGPICQRLGLHFEDYLMWLVLSTKCKFYFMDKPLSIYRIHEEQVSKKFIDGKGHIHRLAGTEEVFNLFRKELVNNVPEEINLKMLRQSFGDNVIWSAKRLPLHQLPKLVFWVLRYGIGIKFTQIVLRRFVSYLTMSISNRFNTNLT